MTAYHGEIRTGVDGGNIIHDVHVDLDIMGVLIRVLNRHDDEISLLDRVLSCAFDQQISRQRVAERAVLIDHGGALCAVGRDGFKRISVRRRPYSRLAVARRLAAGCKPFFIYSHACLIDRVNRHVDLYADRIGRRIAIRVCYLEGNLLRRAGVRECLKGKAAVLRKRQCAISQREHEAFAVRCAAHAVHGDAVRCRSAIRAPGDIGGAIYTCSASDRCAFNRSGDRRHIVHDLGDDRVVRLIAGAIRRRKGKLIQQISVILRLIMRLLRGECVGVRNRHNAIFRNGAVDVQHAIQAGHRSAGDRRCSVLSNRNGRGADGNHTALGVEVHCEGACRSGRRCVAKRGFINRHIAAVHRRIANDRHIVFSNRRVLRVGSRHGVFVFCSASSRRGVFNLRRLRVDLSRGHAVRIGDGLIFALSQCKGSVVARQADQRVAQRHSQSNVADVRHLDRVGDCFIQYIFRSVRRSRSDGLINLHAAPDCRDMNIIGGHRSGSRRIPAVEDILFAAAAFACGISRRRADRLAILIGSLIQYLGISAAIDSRIAVMVVKRIAVAGVVDLYDRAAVARNLHLFKRLRGEAFVILGSCFRQLAGRAGHVVGVVGRFIISAVQIRLVVFDRVRGALIRGISDRYGHVVSRHRADNRRHVRRITGNHGAGHVILSLIIQRSRVRSGRFKHAVIRADVIDRQRIAVTAIVDRRFVSAHSNCDVAAVAVIREACDLLRRRRHVDHRAIQRAARRIIGQTVRLVALFHMMDRVAIAVGCPGAGNHNILIGHCEIGLIPAAERIAGRRRGRSHCHGRAVIIRHFRGKGRRIRRHRAGILISDLVAVDCPGAANHNILSGHCEIGLVPAAERIAGRRRGRSHRHGRAVSIRHFRGKSRRIRRHRAGILISDLIAVTGVIQLQHQAAIRGDHAGEDVLRIGGVKGEAGEELFIRIGDRIGFAGRSGTIFSRSFFLYICTGRH